MKIYAHEQPLDIPLDVRLKWSRAYTQRANERLEFARWLPKDMQTDARDTAYTLAEVAAMLARPV